MYVFDYAIIVHWDGEEGQCVIGQVGVGVCCEEVVDPG